MPSRRAIRVTSETCGEKTSRGVCAHSKPPTRVQLIYECDYQPNTLVVRPYHVFLAAGAKPAANSRGFSYTNLPRVALGVLVDREVADVHKLIRKARCLCIPNLCRRTQPATTVGVRSQVIGSAGGQNVGRPVQPRGHVGSQEGVRPEVELTPPPKLRPRHVSLKRRRNAPQQRERERVALSGCRDALLCC